MEILNIRKKKKNLTFFYVLPQSYSANIAEETRATWETEKEMIRIDCIANEVNSNDTSMGIFYIKR